MTLTPEISHTSGLSFDLSRVPSLYAMGLTFQCGACGRQYAVARSRDASASSASPSGWGRGSRLEPSTGTLGEVVNVQQPEVAAADDGAEPVGGAELA